ncbi:response regulator transcription factor [Dietzia sp. MNB45]|uniref:response regulator transcription factor n=1 Tax=Dietzia sp. MNB45 TaxID=3238800 RepID=UPI003F81BB67
MARNRGKRAIQPEPLEAESRRRERAPIVRSRWTWPAKEAGLSPREGEMSGMIEQGLSNEEVAERCYLSPNSVKTYVSSACQEMDVSTRAQAVTWGIGNGIKLDR